MGITSGHVQSIAKERIPKQILTWNLQERIKRGRSKKSLREGIDGEIREKGLEDDQWMDRDVWGLGNGRRRRTLKTDL